LIITAEQPKEYKIVKQGFNEHTYYYELKHRNLKTGRWDISFLNDNLNFIYEWLKSWNINTENIPIVKGRKYKKPS